MPHVPFLAVVIGSTVVDVLIFAVILLLTRRREPRGGPEIGTGRLLAATSVTGVILTLKLLGLKLAGVGTFGIINLVYADLTILLPSAGLVLLVGRLLGGRGEPRCTLTPLVRLIAVGCLVPIPVGIYATCIEPFRLQLETARVSVAASRAGKGVVRIGVLSDIQMARVTDYERAAVARLMALKPDVILLPGDLFQGSPSEFQANRAALRDLLGGLSAPGGVYFALGDVDGPGRHLRALLPSTSVRMLVNEVVRVRVGDRRVTIGCVELDYGSGEAQELVDRLETDPGDDDIRVLVAHRPDVALGLRPGSRIDLVVAGHTHGGQVVVPWFGPPVTLSRVPRAVAAGGLHLLSENAVYVSRGVGCERGEAPRVRFLCPPEISLLDVGGRAGRRRARP